LLSAAMTRLTDGDQKELARQVLQQVSR